MIDINSLIKGKNFEEEKLLAYGFIKKEEGYFYTTELDEGEISILVEVSLDLMDINDLVINTVFGDEYTLISNASVQGDYVNKIRCARDTLMLDIADKCVTAVNKQEMMNNAPAIYLIPEQVEDRKRKLSTLNVQRDREIALQNQIASNRSLKYNNPKELPSVMDNSSYIRATEIQENMDQILTELKDYQLPQPSGEEIQVGSFVSYRDISDDRKSGITRQVMVIQGDLSIEKRMEADIKFVTTSSCLGEALMEHKRDDICEYYTKDSNGRSTVKHMIFIENVDNDYFYQRYGLENSMEMDDVKVKR